MHAARAVKLAMYHGGAAVVGWACGGLGPSFCEYL